MEMDTDSAYVALSAPLCPLVRPGMRNSFDESYRAWFPRHYCEQYRESFVKTQIAVYKGVMRGCQKSAVPISTSTTHAHLRCSRVSLKALAWWHPI